LALPLTAVGLFFLGIGCAEPTHPEDRFPLDAANIARVVCTERGTSLRTPVVQAQPDGVHIRVTNEAGENVTFVVDEIGGDNPEGEQVWPLPPGTGKIGCWYSPEEPDLVTVEVVDPRGLWVSPRLDCRSVVSGEGDGGVERGDPRDPILIAREFFEVIAGPLGPDDAVERAGYPKAQIRQVRLVREDRVVAVANYVDASFGGGEAGSGWIEEGYQACADL
jgi:hypothetical protein